MNRLTSAGATNYSYDAADRLTQVAVTGGNTTNLVYDVVNQLGKSSDAPQRGI